MSKLTQEQLMHEANMRDSAAEYTTAEIMMYENMEGADCDWNED